MATPASPASSLEDYLRERVPTCLPTGPSVVDIAELSAGVWAVELEDGARVVAKHQPFGARAAGRPDDPLAPDDPLVVEPRVLGILATHDCPVAPVLAVDPETRFIFFEHRGDRTLDDVAQESGEMPAALDRDLVAGFCQIERVLSERQAELRSHVSGAATRERLFEATAPTRAQARDGLARLLRHCEAPRSARHTLETRLAGIVEGLHAREPTLASTDFNARNVVVDSGTRQISFIEFAKIGWDWPERRLVQYATSLGARRPQGSFVGTLTPPSALQYAAADDGRAFALDGHHILFHLLAAAMLGQALERPAPPRHQALLDAWRRPRVRLRQLALALTTPLTDDERTKGFRAQLAAAADPFLRGEHR